MIKSGIFDLLTREKANECTFLPSLNLPDYSFTGLRIQVTNLLQIYTLAVRAILYDMLAAFYCLIHVGLWQFTVRRPPSTVKKACSASKEPVLLDGEAAVLANFDFLTGQEMDVDDLEEMDNKLHTIIHNPGTYYILYFVTPIVNKNKRRQSMNHFFLH